MGRNCGKQAFAWVKAGFDHRCCYCGKPEGEVELTRDHFWPRAKGGRNGHGNIVPACRGCQELKADRKPTEVLVVEHYCAIVRRMREVRSGKARRE